MYFLQNVFPCKLGFDLVLYVAVICGGFLACFVFGGVCWAHRCVIAIDYQRAAFQTNENMYGGVHSIVVLPKHVEPRYQRQQRRIREGIYLLVGGIRC